MLPDGTVRQRRGRFWKFGGHAIRKDEIDELVGANPEIIVVGTGIDAKANLSSDALLALQGEKVDLIVLPSAEAVQKLNQLVDEGKRVSALVHITC